MGDRQPQQEPNAEGIAMKQIGMWMVPEGVSPLYVICQAALLRYYYNQLQYSDPERAGRLYAAALEIVNNLKLSGVRPTDNFSPP